MHPITKPRRFHCVLPFGIYAACRLVVPRPHSQSHPPFSCWGELSSGKSKKQCDHRKGVCNFFRSHARLRPEKNDKHVREDRGSVYPDAFCLNLVLEANRLMGIVRTLELDPAFTADGNHDKCTMCGNLARGGDVYACDGCPDVYHFKCIPAGCPKPVRNQSEGWFCPASNCQAKRRAAIAVDTN